MAGIADECAKSFLISLQCLRSASNLINSASELESWLEYCSELTRLISRVLEQQTLSVGAKQRLTSYLLRLKSLKVVTRAKFSRTGAGFSGARQPSASTLQWADLETAFKSRISTGAIVNVEHIDPRQFLQDARPLVINRVRDYVKQHNAVKTNATFNAEFTLQDKVEVKSFQTRNHELYASSDLDEWYGTRVLEPILSSLEEFQERDSGWALSRIESLQININRLQPLHAGCHVQLPPDIQLKKAVVNVKSNDNACFLWAIVASLYPAAKYTDRVSSYPHYSTVLRTEGIELPVTVKQIPKFERQNAISVNVYGLNEEDDQKQKKKTTTTKCLPLYLTSRKQEKHVNLLLVRGSASAAAAAAAPTDENHFLCIQNLSRLISAQTSKHDGAKFVCDRCLHYFYSEERLTAHSIDCQRLNDCAIILPSTEDKWLHFENHRYMQRAPFIVYADFECLLEDVSPADHAKQRTFAYQHHKAYSVAYYVHCAYDNSLSSFHSYRDRSDCIEWFVKKMYDLGHRLDSLFRTVVPMQHLTREQWSAFRNAKLCYICKQPFTDSEKKVRDHCHFTGKFRGAAHSNCNLNYQNNFTVPVVFHNLSGYDAHFVIKELATAFEGKVDLLPITKEKYISFTKHVADTGENSESNWRKKCVKFRFIDSCKFLSSSLDKLSSYLGRDRLRIVRKEFKDLSDSKFELLTRKGIFPYDYVSRYEKLSETCLPTHDSFYSKLNDTNISESDYAHAVNVWNSFGIGTLGDYSDLYLKIDVLLLADVFENFRDDCIASYNLDPAHYYTLPGFTWDAMLKYTGIKFELLTDVDMLMFVERGIRGGLSQCSHRYAKANNKYMPSHDPTKPSKYLMYFDVNNLYGWAMSQPLPYGGFRWIDESEFTDNDDAAVNSIAADGSKGYIFEVDLEYPRSLHDLHADLPLCPVREKPPGKKKELKLLATVYDRERYVIHYRNLQQCLRHGVKLKKIHRVLQFDQSPWLRSYIELNTALRTQATNEFGKNLFKLMNNAVFGKTMENVRNHVDVKLITQWDGRFGAESLISQPNFHSRTVFSENLVAIEMRKLEIKFFKPVYVGMCILDISKTCLYSFHYDYMLPVFSDKCKILYTDTDSLIYDLECEDAYEIVKRDIHRFDTSDYAANNVYDMPRVNKKVPGLMKDENNGAITTEFVGLRAKMYAIRVQGSKITKKIKGVKSNVVAKKITFDDYVRCLQDNSETTVQQRCIRSKLHQVYSVAENKIALSPHDDKRFIVPGSTRTLPWGHYDIDVNM